MSKQTYPDKPELTKGFGKCVLSRCYRLRLDSSGDGVLEAAEVKILLQGLADGKEPAEEELTFIMRTIGHKNKEKITRAQLTQAIESWTLYLQEFGSDDSAGKVLFEKYDKSKTGKLDHEELKSLLIDLAGRDVSQEDVDWIMAKAGRQKGAAVCSERTGQDHSLNRRFGCVLHFMSQDDGCDA
ncbi:unnamed protein product [Durusdinium trenchii]|uniref:EF-hand domain-containing protein n=1 Tax=Durusdinium trenchii TaxID=1381693 RepID=A0ABP0IJQ6_9DINO